MAQNKPRARRPASGGRREKPTVAFAAVSDMADYAAAVREDLRRHYELVAEASAAIADARRRS